MQVQSPEDPWSREWQATPAFLPGKFYGQRCHVYSPWGHKESDMTGHSYYMGHLLEQRTKTARKWVELALRVLPTRELNVLKL